MTKWQYWSPLIIGGVVGEIYGLQAYRSLGGNPLVLVGVLPLLSALIWGIGFQLLALAAQGLFAAVLPVPVGKSIRGVKCRVIGFLMLSGSIVGLLFRLSGGLAYLGSEWHTLDWFWSSWFIFWAAFAGLSYPVALAMYVYSLPTAEPDFQDKD